MPCGLDSRGFPVSRYYHSMMDLDEEMTDFLRYLEDSRDEVADQSESDLVRLIHAWILAEENLSDEEILRRISGQ